MELKEIESAIEGVLFAAGEPVGVERLCLALDIDRITADSVCQRLADAYRYERRGIRLVRLDNSYQLCSAPEFADCIRRAFESRRPARLSQPALEVLAIIAYYQPATRAYVDQIRGVDSAYTVGLLLDSLKLKDPKAENGRVMDDWIYVQERDVKIGRLQLFNNWSPYMVKDPDTVFMGLEYFCDEGDEMWNTPDQEFIDFAVGELEKLGIVERSHVKDAVLIRVPKAYPAYFGTYGQFGEIRKFTDSLENLFLLGRNGQHRYNNMDHSMLTAMAAAEAILSGNVRDKSPVWEINTEEEYHEEKQGA